MDKVIFFMPKNFPRIRAFSATTTVKSILEANPKRKAVLIYNNGAATVELLDSETSKYGQGIPIAAGTSYENDHFNCQGEYFVVAAAGTVDLRIEEDIAEKGE
jgi:hypothetical protein